MKRGQRFFSLAHRVLLLATLALLFGGCVGGATVRVESGVDRFIDLVGGRVELREPLQVPAGKARVFLQHGKVRSGFDFYVPHCSFEIRSVDHDGVTIAADTFGITRVTHEITEVVQLDRVRFASLASADVDAGGISQRFEGYHFSLNSARQPEVMRMSCFGLHAQPGDLWPPTLREIGATLGDIARLYPPGG